MPKREWSVHGLLSRVLAGGTMGCVVLLVTDIAFIAPIWRPLWKGDERWETVFGIAAYGLPAALLLGACAGLAWRWSRPFRLRPAGMVGCCLAVALISMMLRPVVDRTRRGPDPLYEVVPDTMAAAFSLGALVVAASGSVWHIVEWRRQKSPSGELSLIHI